MSKGILEPRFLEIIAKEAGCRPGQIEAASALFAEGATVPFVARYRKEATSGLDDEQLEEIAKRRTYFLDLAERRDAILESITEQDKLTPALEKAIRAALTKQGLEDLYLPYKPKRRTRAEIARQKGLEPLADLLLAQATQDALPNDLAAAYVDTEKGVEDDAAALAGARDILAERLAEDASNRSRFRQTLRTQGELKVRVLRGKEEEGQVFKDYFDYSEPSRKIPSHRLLAILRGEREGILLSDLAVDDEAETERLAQAFELPLTTPCGRELSSAAADSYKRLLRPSITNEVRGNLREQAETEAIRVFRANLEALLLQSPLGQVSVMGLDPGFRTGCKLAVVGATGRVLATDVIYPVEPKARTAQAASKIAELIRVHKIHAVAVGNGTASRETEVFARQAVKEAKLEAIVAIVPETGASVYSASAAARDELPDLDVTLRGAVSIARRLQDPLAELVKIEPKSLGVGQYQHDVDQRALDGELDLAVESAVNRVGVELNTASAALLRRVSGLTERGAKGIVAHRDQHGPFSNRRTLLEVKGFGAKTFELAGGFLRIRGGENPLDHTAVHPERYGVVQKMAKELDVDVKTLVGDPALVGQIRFDRFVDVEKGLGKFTLDDIKSELERPGRDPRPDFKTPELRDDVVSIDDLQAGMDLEGRVSNVTNFGAFVDIGVKRDGLVHLSQLADRWVADPREVVQVGQVVRVRVVDVDKQRGRIGLSMRSDGGESAGSGQGKKHSDTPRGEAPRGDTPRGEAPRGNAPKGTAPGSQRPPKDQRRGKGGGARPPAGSRKPSGPASLEDLAEKFKRR